LVKRRKHTVSAFGIPTLRQAQGGLSRKGRETWGTHSRGGIQQPRVSELMRGKLSTLSVARLLLYADLLGAEAEVKLKSRAHAAA